ncbi:hypothetical protein SDRG_01806 [Saprolegnia diclina VS20]|uniref:Uncharacterized protein n=1 Tax=Saprolegnia diclina (strain VS20) TaxID=1156394 RepID=T0QRG3_SAPDV|nr:hypothetical protein SDRG_01806 [Saprolegnia diclina VS20]EQC40734.1 hypothetical protein SDRG_01806 [Saprolegnia diclina VS20]|eukprot:XP_008605578.1 hypothetical protein SDRG_01806 [Saprolegnia diclina VS20]
MVKRKLEQDGSLAQATEIVLDAFINTNVPRAILKEVFAKFYREDANGHWVMHHGELSEVQAAAWTPLRDHLNALQGEDAAAALPLLQAIFALKETTFHNTYTISKETPSWEASDSSVTQAKACATLPPSFVSPSTATAPTTYVLPTSSTPAAAMPSAPLQPSPFFKPPLAPRTPFTPVSSTGTSYLDDDQPINRLSSVSSQETNMTLSARNSVPVSARTSVPPATPAPAPPPPATLDSLQATTGSLQATMDSLQATMNMLVAAVKDIKADSALHTKNVFRLDLQIQAIRRRVDGGGIEEPSEHPDGNLVVRQEVATLSALTDALSAYTANMTTLSADRMAEVDLTPMRQVFADFTDQFHAADAVTQAALTRQDVAARDVRAEILERLDDLSGEFLAARRATATTILESKRRRHGPASE